MTGNNSNNVILLTGAGFTRNFGGLLADEMWAEIFNHRDIRQRPDIQGMMRDGNFDFEKVYEDIVYDLHNKTLDASDKKLMEKVIYDAYKRQDGIIKSMMYENDDSIRFALYELIRGVDYFFTLNQDIFIERETAWPSTPLFLGNKRLTLPGIAAQAQLNDSIELPSKAAELSIPDRNKYILYMKLHGSFNWRSATGDKMMMIGHHKRDAIEKEPVLEWYYEIWEQALGANSELLIIGYGFRDKHINQSILNAIKSHNLRVYVVSPERPQDFFMKLNHGFYYQRDIYDNVMAYFPCETKDFLAQKLFKTLS